MNSIAVIYTSKYGNTKKYAQWIAEEAKADLYESSKVKISNFIKYDTIIYGGGLYASKIAGISIITKNYEALKDKNIVVFTVGIAATDREEVFSPIIEKNFSEEMRNRIKFYHLRGDIDYKSLGFVHKAMMGMLKKVITKKKPEDLTEDDKGILDTFGRKTDFIDKATIEPMLLFLRNKN
ncbi:MAG: flavodoxin [Tissierella sp.]|nr:flavodoxin [Tissierella sp.]